MTNRDLFSMTPMIDDFCFDDYEEFSFTGPSLFESDALRLILKTKVAANPIEKWVPVYHYIIYCKTQKTAIGHINFRVGNTYRIKFYDGHIGYRIAPSFRGKRFAQQACELLSPLFIHHQFDTLTLTCRPDNKASLQTIRNLGTQFIERRRFQNLPTDWDCEKLIFSWRPNDPTRPNLKRY